MTSREVLVRLFELRNDGGFLLYERLTLANKLLSDHDWVRAPEGGGGNEHIALVRLEADCFADICGALSLPQMLEILYHIPQVKTWKHHKFNLRKMWEEMRAKTAKPKKISHTPPPSKTSEYGTITKTPVPVNGHKPLVTSEVDQLRRENEELKQKLVAAKANNSDLRHQIQVLKEENRRLKATIRDREEVYA